jgi:mycofactocin system FadH/OYE family oxidoreductase 1
MSATAPVPARDVPAAPELTGPVVLAGRSLPSRVVFGPHETNLGVGRSLSERHTGYYARRAAGGAGLIVTETASIRSDDWPYERAPLAADCGPGWAQIVAACRPHGTRVLAGLGHTGGQGSSAFSQQVTWAPSAVPDAISRELPAEMGPAEIEQVLTGFTLAARIAAASGVDGVEIDAGPGALLRQFHSGLTNLRQDSYGEDRLKLTREVLATVREAIGPDRILSLRLSCDELAPWAGVTPEHAAEQVAALAPLVDLLVVTKGGPFSSAAYRPTGHVPAGFNRDLCRQMRDAAAGNTAIVLQGSEVSVTEAQQALDTGIADLVEMTRAQIAEPDLVRHARAGQPERIRPCVLCNQTCRARDNRNPVVTCIGEPASGYETREPAPGDTTDPHPRDVLIVGAGPAGLEAGRVLAGQGHRVEIAERSASAGGMLRVAAAGAGRERLALLADWLEAECRRLGAHVTTGVAMDQGAVTAAQAAGREVLIATGSRSAERSYPAPAAGRPGDAGTAPHLIGGAELLASLWTDPELTGLPAGEVVLHDPIGGPIAVSLAERLAASGRSVAIVSQDPIIGTLLSLSGDLAPANTRLQQAGVRRELRSLLRAAGDGVALLEDVWTGEQRQIPCAVLVDCGHRFPDESLAAGDALRAGDCVAPRTVLEAVLEGRRQALSLTQAPVLQEAGR